MGRYAQSEVPRGHGSPYGRPVPCATAKVRSAISSAVCDPNSALLAITAAAHRLVRIIFHLITARQDFDDSKFAASQLRDQQRQKANLRAKAKALGFQVTPLEQAALLSSLEAGRPRRRDQKGRNLGSGGTLKRFRRGSGPDCQWCLQTLLEAWSQAPRTKQWLQS